MSRGALAGRVFGHFNRFKALFFAAELEARSDDDCRLLNQVRKRMEGAGDELRIYPHERNTINRLTGNQK